MSFRLFSFFLFLLRVFAFIVGAPSTLGVCVCIFGNAAHCLSAGRFRSAAVWAVNKNRSHASRIHTHTNEAEKKREAENKKNRGQAHKALFCAWTLRKYECLETHFVCSLFNTIAHACDNAYTHTSTQSCWQARTNRNGCKHMWFWCNASGTKISYDCFHLLRSLVYVYVCVRRLLSVNENI